jgi:hypothetical protein
MSDTSTLIDAKEKCVELLSARTIQEQYVELLPDRNCLSLISLIYDILNYLLGTTASGTTSGTTTSGTTSGTTTSGTTAGTTNIIQNFG